MFSKTVGCLLLFCGLFLVFSCGKDDPAPASSSSFPNFLSIASNTLPQPGTDSASILMMDARTNPSWFTNGWIGYEVFTLFADPAQYDPDSSVWGVENILNSINLAGTIFNAATTPLTALTTTVDAGTTVTVELSAATASSALTTSFTPGFATPPNVTYQYQRTVDVDSGDMALQLAWLQDGATSYLLDKETTSNEWSHTEGEYNQSTRTLRLNRVCKANSTFLMRVEVNGNDNTGEFQVRTLKRGIGGSPKFIAVTGAGIAKETVATNHYILKVDFAASSSSAASATTYWFCIISDVAESDFDAYATATSTTTTNNYAGTKIEQRSDSNFTISACQNSEYITTINAMTPFTETDLPDADSNYSTDLF